MGEAGSELIALETAKLRRPAHLYRIWRADGSAEWKYTSHDEPVLFGGETFEPAPIRGGRIRRSSEVKTSTLSLDVDLLADPVLDALTNWPMDLLYVMVIKVFLDNLDDASAVFFGFLDGMTVQGRRANVTVSGYEKLLERNYPRFRTQVQCNYCFADSDCGLNEDDWAIETTATFQPGNALYSADFDAYPNDSFTWGWVYCGGHKRMIIRHTGQAIWLRYPMPGVSYFGSYDVRAVLGCDRTLKHCRDKFSNHVNFGGFPWIPESDPVTSLRAPTSEPVGKK